MARKLKVGDVVEATCVITDKDEHGNIYIHAVPGTLGVVDSADFRPDWPNIMWHKGTGGHGVCNTSPDTFKRYTGRVVCVVG